MGSSLDWSINLPSLTSAPFTSKCRITVVVEGFIYSEIYHILYFLTHFQDVVVFSDLFAEKTKRCFISRGTKYNIFLIGWSESCILIYWFQEWESGVKSKGSRHNSSYFKQDSFNPQEKLLLYKSAYFFMMKWLL